MTLTPRLFAAAIVVGLAAAPAFAARFEAAVIGNVSYPAAPLANAARDATTVAQALAEAGFSVSTHFDIERADISRVLEEISAQFEGAEIGVVYYAGHAFQFDGQNQLLAVDVTELTADQINAKRIPLSDVMQAVAVPKDAASGNALRVVFVDACRNDPFSALDSSYARGISFQESGGAQTLIAYSTSAGELAFDGPKGGNGPYALALSRAIRSEGTTISSALRAVRRDVRVATEGLQIPWVVGSIEVDPVFGPDTERGDAVQVASADGPTLDEVLWYFLQHDLTTDGLHDFVSIFPQSRYTPDATRRIGEIAEATDSDSTRGLTLVGGAVTAATLQGLARASAAAEVIGETEVNSTIPAELFAIWPDMLPDAPGGLNGIVTKCDVLASDPADPQRVAPPTRDGLVNLRNAARACAAALSNDPENPRLLFQFGRILDVAGRYDWARTYYNRAAFRDYSAALTNLGYMAIRGRGGERNYDAAGTYYRRAAALGNLRARTNVGTMYIRGQGREAQPEEGVLWYRLAAGMGWANAQNALADLYRKGIGVEKDEQAALSLYQLAAANGQREAMNALGRSYAHGWGTEKDRVKSHLWFERAVAAGDRFAPRFYAQDLIASGAAKDDPDRVLDLFRLSADRGFLDGFRELARVYSEGELVKRDLPRAYENARRAEIGKVRDIDDLIAGIRADLGADAVARIDAKIVSEQRLNGL